MRGWPVVVLMVVVAIGCFALAAVYMFGNTDFLASHAGTHLKHAVVMVVLGVLALVGASYARPRVGA